MWAMGSNFSGRCTGGPALALLFSIHSALNPPHPRSQHSVMAACIESFAFPASRSVPSNAVWVGGNFFALRISDQSFAAVSDTPLAINWPMKSNDGDRRRGVMFLGLPVPFCSLLVPCPVFGTISVPFSGLLVSENGTIRLCNGPVFGTISSSESSRFWDCLIVPLSVLFKTYTVTRPVPPLRMPASLIRPDSCSLARESNTVFLSMQVSSASAEIDGQHAHFPPTRLASLQRIAIATKTNFEDDLSTVCENAQFIASMLNLAPRQSQTPFRQTTPRRPPRRNL